MTNEEINELFQLAGQYAEKAYREIFNRKPDTTNDATCQVLDMMVHAWLSGYYQNNKDSLLDNTLFEIFGYNASIMHRYIDLSQ